MTIELFGLDGIALAIVRAFVLTTIAVGWTMLLVRLVGLRAFAKMTALDFVTTVATASLIAQAATRIEWTAYAQALAALAALFLIQWGLARLRLAWPTLGIITQNKPKLLVLAGNYREQAMRQARVSRENVLEKIRASHARSPDEVGAVVLETTGEMTVLVGVPPDPRLLEGVEGYAEAHAQGTPSGTP